MDDLKHALLVVERHFSDLHRDACGTGQRRELTIAMQLCYKERGKLLGLYSEAEDENEEPTSGHVDGSVEDQE